MTDETIYLKDTEVAVRYKISRSTVWRWLKTGIFPDPVKIGQGVTRWKLSELEKWELDCEDATDNV